jgi:hypothetical protein
MDETHWIGAKASFEPCHCEVAFMSEASAVPGKPKIIFGSSNGAVIQDYGDTGSLGIPENGAPASFVNC